jgi:Ca2+-binding EF-hand superfamily protein
MISGISGSSSYSGYASSSTTTSTDKSKKFAEDLLKKLDANGDGSVDKDELSSAVSSDPKDGITVSLSKAFSDLDSNDDDSLDADELAAMPPPPPPPMQMDAGSATDQAQDLLSALDTDGDGSISESELTTALQGNSSSNDSNTSTQATEALNRMVAALSDRYNLNSSATAGKYVSTSA